MNANEISAELDTRIKEIQREVKALERAKMALNGTKPQRRKRRRRSPTKTEPASDPVTTPVQTL